MNSNINQLLACRIYLELYSPSNPNFNLGDRNFPGVGYESHPRKGRSHFLIFFREYTDPINCGERWLKRWYEHYMLKINEFKY